MGSTNLPSKLIEYTFYALFFLVPLVWLPLTSELFEFNKITLVYLGTSIIVAAWLWKTVTERVFTLKRTPLDIPILLFLAANILSTILSIDRHISIFGYYSRFNGGLVSTSSYIILYYAFVTFFDRERLSRALKILIFSAFLVSIYAVLQHPTPLFRNSDGSFSGIDAGYWQQDAQARAFSTLGHPNWLAAFLTMAMPFALFFLILAKTTWEKVYYTVVLILAFLAFTFTYSRGGSIGFLAMLFVLDLGTVILFRGYVLQRLNLRGLTAIFSPKRSLLYLGLALGGWLAAFYFFGNALISRGVNVEAIRISNETALAGPVGAETGKIRLIVWEGAWQIFTNYPIFGSGVETFGLAYYRYKPVEHNLTGEWNFIYNKAHNEFLNYLATTGTAGFVSYFILIITPVIWLLVNLNIRRDNMQKYFGLVALSSLAGYHVQNLFGFSVVAIALLFYLMPAMIFVWNDALAESKINLLFLRPPLNSFLGRAGVILAGAAIVYFVFGSWLADYYYNLGISSGSPTSRYDNLKIATKLRPDEPQYSAELGLATISLANRGETNHERIEEGFSYLNKATQASLNNIPILSIRLQAIYELATTKKEYLPQVVTTAEAISGLAPNDAEITFNLASVYVTADELKKAQTTLEKAVELKFNYKEAWNLLLKVDRQLSDNKSYEVHSGKFKSRFPNEEILIQ